MFSKDNFKEVASSDCVCEVTERAAWQHQTRRYKHEKLPPVDGISGPLTNLKRSNTFVLAEETYIKQNSVNVYMMLMENASQNQLVTLCLGVPFPMRQWAGSDKYWKISPIFSDQECISHFKIWKWRDPIIHYCRIRWEKKKNSSTLTETTSVLTRYKYSSNSGCRLERAVYWTHTHGRLGSGGGHVKRHCAWSFEFRKAACTIFLRSYTTLEPDSYLYLVGWRLCRTCF